MGPLFWRHPTSGLKKCSERTRDFCTDHFDCCAVTPCTYCLELEFYGEDIQYGTAAQSANHWTGTVGGYSFDAYWDRNYETDECEFVVEFDGEEVYRNDCYGGQSCRDSSDETGVMIGYDDATLRWIKHEPLPLPHINDPDIGCKTWFCDECECTCDCLCVTITDSYDVVTSGEICDITYDCDTPIWEGTVGDYELSIALGRDDYGQCIITATVNGVEQAAVLAPGCGEMASTITLDDGTTISVACKVCDCLSSSCQCCPGWPQGSSAAIYWTTANAVANDCNPDVPSIAEVTADFGCVGAGDELGTLLRHEATDLFARVFCDPETKIWKVQYRSAVSGGGFESPSSAVWVDAPGVVFVCPDCANAVGGIATGTIDFTAVMGCEISGPTIVPYDILCHADVEIVCP